MTIRNLLLIFCLAGACLTRVSAQDDDLLAGLEPDTGREPVLATFKRNSPH